VVLATDLLHPSDNSEAVNVGAEYTFWDTLSLRGGAIALFEEDRTSRFSLGAGVHRRVAGGVKLSADYAYAQWGVLNDTHRFTVSISR